jgi:ribonuclease HI
MNAIKEIYIDGASRGNPGRASYAVIIYGYEGEVIKRGEIFDNKTNNQMEFLAGCKALQFISESPTPNRRIPIYSDSKLLCDMFNKSWIYRWEANNTIDEHPNSDLIWKLLLTSYKIGKIFKFIWVKGHSDNQGNIEADKYCNYLLDNY